MSIQGSGHYGVIKFEWINLFNSVLNFTLVVVHSRPGGSISHILIPLIIGLFSIPKSFDIEHLFSYFFSRSLEAAKHPVLTKWGLYYM